MGAIAARKAERVIGHVRYILATELFAATQALRLRAPLKPGHGVQAAFDYVAAQILPLVADRSLAPEIAAIESALKSDSMLLQVESTLGGLR